MSASLSHQVGAQHVAVLSEDGRVNYSSVYLGVTQVRRKSGLTSFLFSVIRNVPCTKINVLCQALIKKKNPMLHDHFMTLTALGVSDINNPFYDFLNESLLRGLSGLLNLETCQFAWDQCFVVGEGIVKHHAG